MSFTAVALILEGLLLAIALLFVLALLRSHAEILRRLAVLERPGRPDGQAAGYMPAGDGRELDHAISEIAGETPAGDAVKLSLGPGSPPTLLAFLSSGCTACMPLWQGLATATAPSGGRLVVVTKGAERESVARIQELADTSHEIIMSTAAWQDLAVPATPHFVLVDGDAGTILGRGSATNWSQLHSLLGDARKDADAHRARSTTERAARAEAALASAGIGAGHPSLYPSRESSSEPNGGTG
ncbi:MAG: TlpA family protein disulfide reductase [Solirubrobacteraceae bacterium]